MFWAARAETAESIEEGTRNRKLMTFSTMPTAAALVGNDGNKNKRNLNKSILEGNGNTHAEDASKNRTGWPEITGSEGQSVFVFPDHKQGEQDTESLRDGGAKSSAGRP